MIKSLSTALFCIALLCYVFPWHGVSFGDKTFAEVSGIRLVTGGTASEKGLFGIEVKRTVDMEPFAALSFLAILGGAAAGFVKERKGFAWSAAAGALAVVLLVVLQWKLGREARGFVESQVRFGFYLALLLSAGAAGLNVHAMMVHRGGREIEDELVEGKTFCSRCGSANAEDDRFCRNCGAPLN